MLSFDIRRLETQPVLVDDFLGATDAIWEDTDARPAETGIHVSGRLSSAGNGRFYFSGHIQGTAAAECRRCLTDVAIPVAEDVHLLFAETDFGDADDGDDVYPIPVSAQVLDMAPAVREEWLLSIPAFALCKPDCLGLCATCGADRNIGECSCSPVSDSRWDVLRAQRDGQP